jgi:hypothetical protein
MSSACDPRAIGTSLPAGRGNMTIDSGDMSTPVTRGELRDELQQLELRIDRKLEIWGGALLARIESSQKQTSTELARHARAIQESVSTQISVIDEKYRDLPARVGRLEATVPRSRKR